MYMEVAQVSTRLITTLKTSEHLKHTMKQVSIMCIHILQQFPLINMSLNTQFTFVYSTQLLPKFTTQHAYWRLLHQCILMCN